MRGSALLMAVGPVLDHTACFWRLFYGTLTGVARPATGIQTVTGTFGQKLVGLNTVCNPSMKIDIYDRWGN